MSGRGGNKGTNFNKVLRINSSNRLNPSSETDTNFTINLGTALQQVSRLSIQSIQIPNVFYNVFQTPIKFNNIFYLSILDAPNSITFNGVVSIAPGYYSTPALITAINSAIQAVDPNMTLTGTISSITGMITLSMAFSGTLAGQSIYFLPATSAQIISTGIYGRQDFNPFALLGFTLVSGGIFAPGAISWQQGSKTAPLTGTSLPSLNQPSLCYIASQALSPSNSFDEQGRITNELIQIDLSQTPWGSYAVFDCKQDILCEVSYGRPRQLTTVDIQLVDHDGDPLSTGGIPINLYLRIWFNTM